MSCKPAKSLSIAGICFFCPVWERQINKILYRTLNRFFFSTRERVQRAREGEQSEMGEERQREGGKDKAHILISGWLKLGRYSNLKQLCLP